MEIRDILMSIRPPWPEMIFSGEKPFEFRNHIGRNWGAGSRLYIYESKAYNGAGMVVGDATIDEIVSIPAGAVGPPRPLLRYWAEKYATWLLPLLDELCDYELPNYKKGTILRYLGRPELLREAMRTGAWVQMFDEGHNPIDACEHWLFRIGLINGCGEYWYKYGLRLSNARKYASPLPLSAFGLNRAPQSWCYTGGPLNVANNNETEGG